jgi:type IV pilus assembly protein PilC
MQYQYKAHDASRTVVEGSIAARSEQEVAQVLARKGLSPLVIRQIVEHSQLKGTLPVLEKVTFCRYMSVMLGSGLSLSEGLDVLRGETKNLLMRQILTDLSYSLEQGQSLSSVFERYPNVFERYFLTLTKAGEMSGTLADVFRYLEIELRSEYSLNSKVKGALMYPGIVFTAMMGIGFLMVFFVMPQIGRVFLNLNMPIPEITRFLFTVSIALSKQMVPILIGLVVGAVSFVFGLKKRAVREVIFHMVRPIPMVRDLIKKVDMARFNRIFSTLLKSAVPITEALEIALNTLSWYEYRGLAGVLPNEIKKGKSLSSVVKDKRVFPAIMVQMISTGEKTGQLDVVLAELATFYEGEVEEELKSLTQIIEPVLMLLVGVAVGAMILSIVAPIYSVVGSFQSAAGGAPGNH